MQSCARIAFELAKDMDQLGVVVDADGLWLVQVSPNIITISFGKRCRNQADVQNEPEVVQGWKGVPRIILTPNIMEFKRLCQAKVSSPIQSRTDKEGNRR
jgi:ATP-dependent NAD(P)H-hydrate dehydratase